MKDVIVKIVLFFTPLVVIMLIVIVFFLKVDPFMMIGDNRGTIMIKEDYIVSNNRDYQSTELFMRNYNEQKYDSFILGNSKSGFFRMEDWDKYVDGKYFHFNSSAESLYGIERKLRFLNDEKVDIKNALLVFDLGTFKEVGNSDGHLFIKHPLISGESYVAFYLEMFEGFFPKAMVAHIDLYLTGTWKAYMRKYGIRKNVFTLDLKNNQLAYSLFDSIILENPDAYYVDKMEILYDRDSLQTFSEVVIEAKQKELLMSIKSILDSQKTNYKIIIDPAFDQKKINQVDMFYLTRLFGDNVYDFTGKNEYTESKYNYYDQYHYRPHLANKVMSVIYGQK